MKTTNDGNGATKYGARIVASFLLAGGLLGLLGSAFSVHHSFQQHRAVDAVSGMISTAFFAWCLPIGLALWRATPKGFRWAKLLFAMQVPVFSIARFSYEFSTFFSLRFMLGNTTRHIGGNIGSSSNLNWLPQSVGFLFGINVVAVLVLLYLIRSSRVCSGSAGNGARRSPSKVKEGTHEEFTEALHARREGRHPEAASAGEGANLDFRL